MMKCLTEKYRKSVCRFLFAALWVAWLGGPLASVRAESPVLPDWIWHNEQASVPQSTRYFRKKVRFDRIRVVKLDITCDNEFVLYLNGKVVAEGNDWQRVHSLDLTDQVRAGDNVLAVRAKNWDGPAGLLVRGYAGWANGTQWTFNADKSWRSSAEEQPGWADLAFDDSQWSKVKVLGKYGKTPSWRGLQWDSGFAGRFSVPDGFRVETVATSNLTGSLTAMSFDSQGRPTVSREHGPVSVLEDTDGDGFSDRRSDVGAQVKDSQGFCWIGDQLYTSGRGPQGDGLYRVSRSAGGEQIDLITKYGKGIGGHGPHGVILGPDGKLYHVLGNHATITEMAAATSPVMQESLSESILLPRYEDPRGHAAGVRAPAGSVWRCNLDGSDWEMVACGMRNPYDIAFTAEGELLTFDADMEWDYGLPWYRPTRVLHCVPGAEFGWRSGSAKWPAHYPDSLPAVINTGRGSPTGVAVYLHDRYGEKYRNSLWLGDWTNGQIVVHHLTRDGATYSSNPEVFATGEPMNITDLEIGPDGNVYFCTGGWSTEGGVYRIVRTDEETNKPVALTPVEQAINQPQPLAAWAVARVAKLKTKAGNRWGPAITAIAVDSTRSAADRIRAIDLMQIYGPDPSETLAIALTHESNADLRRRATTLLGSHTSPKTTLALNRLLRDTNPAVVRSACEALVENGSNVEPAKLVPLLGHPDRFVRYAARNVLQRIDTSQWQETIFTTDDPTIAIEGLIALCTADPPADSDRRLARATDILRSTDLSDEQLTGALRAAQRVLLGATEKRLQDEERLGRLLLDRFPTGNSDADWEIARLLAKLQVDGAAEKITAKLRAAGESRQAQIHYALCLRYLEDGWSTKDRLDYITWFEGKQNWEGGFSFSQYIQGILRDALRSIPAADRRELIAAIGESAPSVAAEAIRSLATADLAEMGGELLKLAAKLRAGTATGGAEKLALQKATVLALGRIESNEAKVYLRTIAGDDNAVNDVGVQAIALSPEEADWPCLVAGLASTDATTLRASLSSLLKLKQSTDNMGAHRTLILAGERLGEQGGVLAVRLHNRWANLELSTKRQDLPGVITEQKEWFAKTFPGQPLVPGATASQMPAREWQFEEVLAHVTKTAANSGDISRGRLLFEKSDCIKCHRFEGKGNGIGPDLTTLSKRFKRKDILTAVFYPSKDINDQYLSVVVETVDGIIYRGMLAPPEKDHIVLLQADSKLVRISKDEVDRTMQSKVSVMPEGAMNAYSLGEIADLLAFLESGREALADEVSVRQEATP